MNTSSLDDHLKRAVKIIVIGAGIAGLSAAERLIKRGFHNVQVFEAGDRIGGRIFTQDFGDGWVEIGAQWIHGEKDNVAYQHAARRNLILPPVNDDDDSEEEKEEVFCTEQDGVLSDQAAPYHAYDYISDKLENCPVDGDVDSKDVAQDDSTVNLEPFIEQQFRPLLRPTAVSEQELILRRAVLDWFKKFQGTLEGCDSLREMSLESFLEAETCQGDMWINFRRGYRTLLASVAETIPESTLHLRRAVRHIRLTGAAPNSGTRAAQVVCEDGSIHEADHVIVTVSLGYLKEHAEELFDPPLPENKMKAIQKMGYGTVDKIFLEFEQSVSPAAIEGYFLLRPEEAPDGASGGRKSSDEPWWRQIHSIEVVPFASNVLCWWISGAEARHMETLPDDEVQSACAELFRRFTKKDKLPPIKSMTRSKWSKDTYARGSYSYLTSELPSAQKACRLLSDPVYANVGGKQRPVILFAGEATHPYYFSTVHGAMETGRREAIRILASYSTKRFTRLERLDSGGSF